MLIIITTGILFGIGMFFILAEIFRVPTYAMSKAANNLGKRCHTQTNFIEVWLDDLSRYIASKLKITEYRKVQLEADLLAADMTVSPEEYMADAIAKALFIGIFSVPMYFVWKMGVLIVFVFAFAVYYKGMHKISGMLKKRKEKIEYELPRFVNSVEKTLKHSRDVIYMLESYRETAGPELKREIEITLADMRSGNMESALQHLETRVGSTMMSDVSRGLFGIISGNDTQVYWATLAMTMADHQRRLLKLQANAVPRKVRKLSLVLLGCFMSIYIVVIGKVLLSSMAVMF